MTGLRVIEAPKWKSRQTDLSTNYSLRLEIAGDHSAIAGYVKDFAKALPTAMDAALKASSDRAREIISTAILNGSGLKGLTPGTLAKRRLGKKKGAVNPPVLPYPRMTPLARSLQYARAIVSSKYQWMQYATGIGIGLGDFSGGKTRIPIAVYALQQEFGFTRSIPITRRMRAYLQILYQGVGRKGDKHIADKKTGKTLTVIVPGRPVWQRVFDIYYASGLIDPDYFLTHFWKVMGSKMPGLTY